VRLFKKKPVPLVTERPKGIHKRYTEGKQVYRVQESRGRGVNAQQRWPKQANSSNRQEVGGELKNAESARKRKSSKNEDFLAGFPGGGLGP